MSISTQSKTQINYWAKVVILGLIFGVGIQVIFAWTVPAATPPGGSITAPVTVGAASQTKTGALGVGSLTVAGKAMSASTVAGDGGTTMVTKDYMDAKIAAATAAGSVLPGTQCGAESLYNIIFGMSAYPQILCGGHNPWYSCPAGYYQAYTSGSNSDNWTMSCIKA